MRVPIGGWAWLDRSAFTAQQERQIKKMLTIRPRKTHPDAEDPSPLRLWCEEDPRKLGVPRMWFLSKQQQNNDVQLETSRGGPWEGGSFNGTLRPEQAKALASVTRTLTSHELALGGLVKAPTGWGKTVFASALIPALAVPTLVLMHREMLIDQWMDSFTKFLPDARIGLVKGKTFDVEGKDVVIAMIQTLTSKGFEPDPESRFYERFGHIITDEAHRIAAPTWSQVLPRFSAHWRTGLSATPRRKDGTEAVFEHHLGPMLYTAMQQALKPLVRRVWTKFDISRSPSFNPKLFKEATLLRYMMRNTARNRVIVSRIIDAYRAGRRVLVLSKRLEHLDILEETILREWDARFLNDPRPELGKCVGGITEKERNKVKEGAEIIFATAQYVAEGFDVPSLDTVFLTMPMADVEQAVGRILRVCDGKKQPIVVDFRDDNIELFKKWGAARDRLYARIAAPSRKA